MATPAMKRWHEIKQQYPDHILLFRMGDFYETFYEDAEKTSKILGITLTKRGMKEKIPLAGIPHHALEQYLKKFVDANQKVVIVEQLENPKLVKGIVKRGVVRVITPGTVVFQELLEQESNNYIASVFYSSDYSVVLADVSTGSIIINSFNTESEIEDFFKIYEPKEILVPDFFSFKTSSDSNSAIFNATITKSSSYSLDYCKSIVLPLFSTKFSDNEIVALGMLLDYVKKTQNSDLSYFKEPTRINKAMFLDDATVSNLELLKNSYDNTSRNTLFSALKDTETAFGARLLRNFILQPLTDVSEINSRLDLVEYFVNDVVALKETKELLSQMYDIERLISKFNNHNVKPFDVVALKNSLKLYFDLYSILHSKLDLPNPEVFNTIIELVENAIKEEPSNDFNGEVIKKGYNKELDDLREIKYGVSDWLKNFEMNEKKKTGINNLRVKYNKVFGFFVEVPKGQVSKVPEKYVRKQTLVNVERFITPELKELETKYFGAEERISVLEAELFDEIVSKISPYSKIILKVSQKIAYIDVLAGFAKLALEHSYIRPEFNPKDIKLIKSRHVVVERNVDFVPNDVDLKSGHLHIITGPNMSGKSTYMRQIALIQIMAQIGSFVPAEYASLPLVDAVFSRIGARDNIASGESTFMVEMKETANILKKATSRSLIILDEIGRGTSTYDGISIAWAVCEYILNEIKAKTLFATHYHVLTHLSSMYGNVENYHTLIKETKDGIEFVRKIQTGGLDKSYGIEVARLAGLPLFVIERARMLQSGFERYDNLKDNVVKVINGTQKNEFMNSAKEKNDEASSEISNSKIKNQIVNENKQNEEKENTQKKEERENNINSQSSLDNWF